MSGLVLSRVTLCFIYSLKSLLLIGCCVNHQMCNAEFRGQNRHLLIFANDMVFWLKDILKWVKHWEYWVIVQYRPSLKIHVKKTKYMHQSKQHSPWFFTSAFNFFWVLFLFRFRNENIVITSSSSSSYLV